MIDIIIPLYNALDYTKKAFDSLQDTFNRYRVIFVDDCSTDGTREWLKTVKATVKLHDLNMGISNSWNDGIKLATSPYVCIANSDVLFSKFWDKPLIKALDEGSWVASPYVSTSVPYKDPKPNRLAVLGCCFMMKRDLFDKIGLFPSDLRLWYGDNWIGDAVEAKGGSCVHVPESVVHHFVSKSANPSTVPNYQSRVSTDLNNYKQLKEKL